MNLVADPLHPGLKLRAVRRSVTNLPPHPEHRGDLSQQLPPQWLRRPVRAVDPALHILYQMCPAPRHPTQQVDHLRPVATDDSATCFARQFVQRIGFACPSDSENRRIVNTLNVLATNAQTHARMSVGLVGDSSIFSDGWSGSRAARSSYAGRSAARATFCNFTTQPGEHGP